MPARVIFVGLDSMDPSLIDGWIDEGRLPTLAALSNRHEGAPLANNVDLLSGSVWSELISGRSAGSTGVYLHVRQLVSGETAPRALTAEDLPRPVWALASDAGCRVAAVDVPEAALAPSVDGVQLVEHTTHEHCFGTASQPAGVLDEIRARHGEYPVPSCEKHDGSDGALMRLRDDLLSAVEYKTAMIEDLLGREEWDLFACAFSEPHCAGHQLFAPHAAGLGAEADSPRPLHAGIRDVYEATDAGLARVLEAAGPDAVCVVVASHGIGFMSRGAQLLPELMVRMGFGSGKGAAARTRSRLPVGVREVLRKVVPRGARKQIQKAAGSLPEPLASSATRAVALPTTRAGAIRINLKGRDPFGCVEPGAEADALIEEIRAELRELRHIDTDEPLVERIATARELFGEDPHPSLPDLMVGFRTDIGPIEACRSPRGGTITPAVTGGHLDWRGGDHRPESRLWVSGPLAARTPPEEARSIDVAPTILAALGVAIPDDLDGRPLVDSATEHARA